MTTHELLIKYQQAKRAIDHMMLAQREASEIIRNWEDDARAYKEELLKRGIDPDQ